MKITVKVTDKAGVSFVQKERATITILMEKDLRRLAEVTTAIIRAKIRESITRPGSTGNLEKGFFAEPMVGGWGVGDIAYLNSNVPYWAHINYGSEGIGANWQHWVPSGAFTGTARPDASAFRTGRWEVGTGGFSFYPKKPIPAANYIERTIAELNTIIGIVLRQGGGG